MAAIGMALWKYVMRYAPHTPDYFNRDRFVLSNGKNEAIMQIIQRHGTDVFQVIPVFSSIRFFTSRATKP